MSLVVLLACVALTLPSMAFARNRDLCNKYPCCDMETSTNNCSIFDMPKTPSTIVFPGGKTRCIFTTSSDFSFQVWPGATDQLLFYFEGGGACWDQSSTLSHLCSENTIPQDPIGIFNRTDPTNKYSAYTIIHVMYCSGDMHAGNVVRPYNDPAGQPVTQVGQTNTRSVFQWVIDQQQLGGLSKVFSDFVIMGCSAGSLATQIWSNEMLATFKYKSAAVVPDSYIGVFPPNSQGPLIYDYGCCVESLLPPDLYALCINQTLTLQDVMSVWLSNNPTIPFNYVQSKADATQMSFYSMLAITVGDDPFITDSEFYSKSIAIMAAYNVNPNFVVYEVNGPQHCFTPYTLYDTAGPLGPNQGPTTGTEMLDEWIPSLPLSSGQSISTVCEGKVQATENIATGISPTYCSSSLVPKTFVSS